MSQLAIGARKSRMEYEAGARSLQKHLVTLNTLHRVYWILVCIKTTMANPNGEITDRRRSMAQTVKLTGGNVRQEYKK